MVIWNDMFGEDEDTEEMFLEADEKDAKIEELEERLRHLQYADIHFRESLGINPHIALPYALVSEMKEALDSVLYGVYRA